KSRIAALTIALLLILPHAMHANCATILLRSAQAPPATTSPRPGASSSAPDPQPRSRDGRAAQTAAAPVSAPNAAPSPPQEPYLRNSFERIRNYIPDLASGLLVFAVGLLVAYCIRFVLLRVLPRTGLDSFLEHNGLAAPASRPSQSEQELRADAEPRQAIREDEPYESYFGRSPARRWRAEESARYRPAHHEPVGEKHPID
ncbi:MAG TPA: hypothetical protein VF493_02350, partial [Terriglobales bacterium]